MAKKYRRKDKDGHEIVTSIYYGNGFSRTTPEGIAELLNGKTPEQHCAMHIAKKEVLKPNRSEWIYATFLIPIIFTEK